MASIFKRRKGKNEPYTIQYTDHRGKRKTAKGFTDKGLSEQLAGKLESEARLRRTGLIDPEQERYAANRRSPILDHLKKFEESLGDNSAKHVKLTMSRVHRLVKGCGIDNLGGIQAEEIQQFLRSLRATDEIGHKTYNHYLQAFDSFCNWCVATKRLLANPIIGLERLNTAVDVRHARRALTPDELTKLVRSARASDERIQRLTGEQRARLYILSYMTGLRKREIGSLTPSSFDLGGVPPTVTLAAACSKHRRKDVLPLHPDLVGMIRQWLSGLGPHDKLFPGLERRETSVMVKKDLERVGIPYQTHAGIADFHAAGRHTHITELLRNGASLPEAKQLARHSDVNLTMRYTHIGIGDQARAVANLPNPQAKPEGALQMRCISGDSGSRSVSPAGGPADRPKVESPWPHESSVANCHRVALADKMAKAGIEPARP